MTDLLGNQYVMALAVFGMFAIVAWIVLEKMAAGKSRSMERLDEIRNPGKRRQVEDSLIRKQEGISRVLEAATPALAAPLQPKTELELNKLKARLVNAGFRNDSAPMMFLGVKVMCLAVGFFIGGGTAVLASGVSQKSMMITVICCCLGLFLPEVALRFLIKRRQQAIFLALPDSLDLMVVCVEAGLGLDQAMRKVAEELANVYPVMAQEFALCNFQLQMGRQRAEVLHELGARTGVSDLRSLAGILIQADKFGSSVAQALRVQSDAMRTRRSQLAEEKAAKTAVKLIFPLVLFIFPGIFVVLVGPAAITMINEMLPTMQANSG